MAAAECAGAAAVLCSTALSPVRVEHRAASSSLSCSIFISSKADRRSPPSHCGEHARCSTRPARAAVTGVASVASYENKGEAKVVYTDFSGINTTLDCLHLPQCAESGRDQSSRSSLLIVTLLLLKDCFSERAATRLTFPFLVWKFVNITRMRGVRGEVRCW